MRQRWQGSGAHRSSGEKLVGAAPDVALAQDISQRSLVLVKDSLGLVPLSLAARRRVVVVAYGDESFPGVGHVFAASLRGAVDTIQVLRLWPASGPASFDTVRSTAAGAGAVIFLSASQPTAWRPDAVEIPAPVAGLIEQLALAGAPLVAVSLGSPYVISEIPHAPAYVAAWSDTEYIERPWRAPCSGWRR